jgi:hypothetical protein
MDISMTEWSLDVIPICIARPVAETGASITGGAAQVGSVTATAVMRSSTSCLARSMSTSESKMSSTDDSCGTDLDRRSSRPSTPLKACSRGTVTNCSTSEVDSPRQAVWTITRGGANSGKTSTRWSGRVTIPSAIVRAPTTTTR